MATRGHLRSLLLVALSLVATQARAYGNTTSVGFEGGYQLGYAWNSGSTGTNLTRDVAYFGYDGEYAIPKALTKNGRLTLDFGARALGDFVNGPEFDLRALSANLKQDNWSVGLGFQRLSWGYTVGHPLYVMDFINPRDLRDPLFTELDWISLPVFTLTPQVFVGGLSLQLVVTPVPRNRILPTQSTAAALFPPQYASIPIAPSQNFNLTDFGKFPEYGARLGFLFPWGMDTGIYYYNFWDRRDVYDLVSIANQLTLVPNTQRMQVVGTGFNQPIGGLVVRGDLLAHLGFPLHASANNPYFVVPAGTNDVDPIQQINLLDAIVGLDYAADSDWGIGTQYQGTFFRNQSLNWINILLRAKFWKDRVEPEVYVFQGLGNSDEYLAVRLGLNLTRKLKLSLWADLVGGSQTNMPGALWPLQNLSRVTTWMSYAF